MVTSKPRAQPKGVYFCNTLQQPGQAKSKRNSKGRPQESSWGWVQELANRWFFSRVENGIITLHGWKTNLELFRLEIKCKISAQPVIRKGATDLEMKCICCHLKSPKMRMDGLLGGILIRTSGKKGMIRACTVSSTVQAFSYMIQTSKTYGKC